MNHRKVHVSTKILLSQNKSHCLNNYRIINNNSKKKNMCMCKRSFLPSWQYCSYSTRACILKKICLFTLYLIFNISFFIFETFSNNNFIWRYLMNSISNVSSQHIVNALQLSNLMSFANLLYKFWIIFNVIIKDNKTRLCFVINQRCLTHVFCTTENNIKYVFLVFSEKIKF